MASGIIVRLPSPARDRVIRVTNVHFAADSEDIVNFSEGYTIQDQHRTMNTRIGTKSVVYVLFATVADKIRSFELSGSMLFGREIKIQLAPNGNYKLNNDETAFVKPGNGKGKNSATKASPSSNAPVFDKFEFPVLGMPQEKETSKSLPATPLASSEVIDTSIESIEAELKKALENMTPNAKEIQARIAELEKSLASAKADLQTAEKNAAAKKVPAKASEQASRQVPTLSSIIAERKSTYAQKGEIDVAETSNMARASPPGVNMPLPITYDNWNLNGHDAYDRSKNLITPSDWYGFQDQRLAKAEQEQEARGTNAARILAESEEVERGRKRGAKK